VTVKDGLNLMASPVRSNSTYVIDANNTDVASSDGENTLLSAKASTANWLPYSGEENDILVIQ
jgi:hypothetical protein